MPISGMAPMRERQDNLNAEGIAADVVDELGLLGEPQAPHMIEAIARAIRRAVEDDRRRTRAIRLGKGLPQHFEEVVPGVRLWRDLSGNPAAVEIEPDVGEDGEP